MKVDGHLKISDGLNAFYGIKITYRLNLLNSLKAFDGFKASGRGWKIPLKTCLIIF